MMHVEQITDEQALIGAKSGWHCAQSVFSSLLERSLRPAVKHEKRWKFVLTITEYNCGRSREAVRCPETCGVPVHSLGGFIE